ncbi:MAG TPA: GDP-mannose 4,6-dehydratase [Acidimicrobiales bacterium]|jgi:UDP-glucose 4-epimerase|nr:GDP-mannose 4,6-dehydratase [Acidimicrobiales bacterium]
MEEIQDFTAAGLAGRRVLVTGGAGFIGSSLSRVLLASGAEVTVFDNEATGRFENLLGCAGEVGAAPVLVTGDVRDGRGLSHAMAGIDIVFHLACLGVRHSLLFPRENHEVNAGGTLRVLEAARARNIGRVVHVSSSEVYGTAQWAPMTEAHPTSPHTVYGASKLAGECYARAYHRCHDLDVVVVRPFNSYGPRSHHEGDSGEVIPRFLVRAMSGDPLVVYGDGNQTRDFTHVYDSALTIARAGVTPGLGGEVVNVGSGVETSVNELLDAVASATGQRVTVMYSDARPGDVSRLVADSTLARELLDHRPRIALRDGLADLAGRLAGLGGPEVAALAAAVPDRSWV